MIDYVDALARAHDRKLMVRLVKGAYWDTEIKRAQERGLDGYPVFTRKAMTDLNYVACASKLLSLRPRIFPQFATHNALTVATVLELAQDGGGFEFQRLHGMGEALYEQLAKDHPDIAYRTYAPVGSHRDLLAYLVRRLLENGANSSFVAQAADYRCAGCGAVAASGRCHRPAASGGPSQNSVAGRSVRAGPAQFARRRIRRARGARPAAGGREGRGSRPQAHSRHNAGPSQCVGDCCARRLCRLEPNAGGHARGRTGAGRASVGEPERPFHRAAASRGRQDAGRCAIGAARGRRLLPLLCRTGSKAVRR
ncbi:hypothetical protein ACVWZ3_007262 [Bradyrhizobium sp. i1.3.6]